MVLKSNGQNPAQLLDNYTLKGSDPTLSTLKENK